MSHLHTNVIKSIRGDDEPKILSLIESLGFVEGVDFVYQFPLKGSVARGGMVLDFAFVEEQICIEADGKYHTKSKMIKKDAERDKELYSAGWVVIRIPVSKVEDSYGLSFYRNLIREVVKDRRRIINDNNKFLYA